MCSPRVTEPSGSAPDGLRLRESHSRAAERSGGRTQFEFSLPRSHAQSAGWPASAAAASPASHACARASPGPCTSCEALPATCPPATTRNRGSPVCAAQRPDGIQFTPLMWPVKSVGMMRHPGRSARSATATRRSSMAASTRSAPAGSPPRSGRPGPSRSRSPRSDRGRRDLRRVEGLPPAHRRPRRPVVDAQPERLDRLARAHRQVGASARLHRPPVVPARGSATMRR